MQKAMESQLYLILKNYLNRLELKALQIDKGRQMSGYFYLF
jgi:hypothetical protein